MGKYLKYYSEENARHADVMPIQWTFEQCINATDMLCDYFKIPRISMEQSFDPYVQKSFYSMKNKSITLHDKMLNPLTVSHEFAHYLDHAQRLDGLKRGIVTSAKWHGPRHRRITDGAVEFVKTLSFYVPFMTTRLEMLKNANQET